MGFIARMVNVRWIKVAISVIVLVQLGSQKSTVECSCGNEVWRKLNMNKVCFGAADGSSTGFTSLFTVNTMKIRYVRRSGHHQCEVDHGGYFACEPFPEQSGRTSGQHNLSVGGTTTTTGGGQTTTSHTYYHHHHHHYHNRPPPTHNRRQYPTRSRFGGHNHHHGVPNFIVHMDDPKQKDEAKTDDVPATQEDEAPQEDANFITGPGPVSYQGVTVFLSDGNDDVLIPQAPHYGTYFVVPGLNRPAWHTAITVPYSGGVPLTITKGMSLKLHYGEDYRNVDTSDNSGTLCLDVYAFGTLPTP